MKTSKRFVQEYANHKIKEIENNSQMQHDFKVEKITRISKAVTFEAQRFITIDEAIKIINEA